MISYPDLILVIGVLAFVGFFGCLVWVVLDNKKFYEDLDKQRYGITTESVPCEKN